MERADATEAVRLAEFNSLRQEIGHRTTIQQGLVALNLTVATSVSALVAASKNREDLFLVVAFASCVFGFLWLDHHLNIHLIGQYVQKVLWRWEPSWEAHIRSSKKPQWWQIAYCLAALLAFVGVAAAAVILASTHLPGCMRWLWWVAIALTSGCAVCFGRVFLAGPGQVK